MFQPFTVETVAAVWRLREVPDGVIAPVAHLLFGGGTLLVQ